MVTIRLPEDLKERIDVARGDVPRERWVRRVLEAALRHGADSAGSVQRPVAHPPSASPRAPVPENVRERRYPVEGTPLPKIAPRRQAK